MKRRVLTILLFLLVGAAENVAVAWIEAWEHRQYIPLGRWEWGWPCDTLYRGPWVSYQTEIMGIMTIPYQPIWPGFIINTVFYAALLWLLTRGPFVTRYHIRRHIRMKRGRCPNCGYDLRGQPPEVGAAGCPECGWNRQPEVET